MLGHINVDLSLKTVWEQSLNVGGLSFEDKLELQKTEKNKISAFLCMNSSIFALLSNMLTRCHLYAVATE